MCSLAACHIRWFHNVFLPPHRQGNFLAAIENYTYALQIEPNHFKALFNRGFSHDKIGDYDAAIADYTAALRVKPGNAFAHYNRGISWDRKGEYQSAIDDFTMAIAMDNVGPWACFFACVFPGRPTTCVHDMLIEKKITCHGLM